MNKNFGLIGLGGYVAPRHMAAMKALDCNLIVGLDPSDSVGVVDSYFPDCKYFNEFERFDRYVDKLRREEPLNAIDKMTICSPNHLHDAHIRFSLRSNADAICEKPLVLNPWNLDGIERMENETGRRVFTILQLRLHPSILRLRERLSSLKSEKKHELDLTYITSRGSWYYQSWKGDKQKSGGIGTNIGIHFFDMLLFLFGPIQSYKIFYSSEAKFSGYFEFKICRVRWFLSIDRSDLPKGEKSIGKSTFRSMTLDGIEHDFTDGFVDLHKACYREILSGRGFGIAEARPSIELASEIRDSPISRLTDDAHPLLFQKENSL